MSKKIYTESIVLGNNKITKEQTTKLAKAKAT